MYEYVKKMFNLKIYTIYAFNLFFIMIEMILAQHAVASIQPREPYLNSLLLLAMSAAILFLRAHSFVSLTFE